MTPCPDKEASSRYILSGSLLLLPELSHIILSCHFYLGNLANFHGNNEHTFMCWCTPNAAAFVIDILLMMLMYCSVKSALTVVLKMHDS